MCENLLLWRLMDGSCTSWPPPAVGLWNISTTSASARSIVAETEGARGGSPRDGVLDCCVAVEAVLRAEW